MTPPPAAPRYVRRPGAAREVARGVARGAAREVAREVARGRLAAPGLMTRFLRRKVLEALDGWTGAPLTVALPDGTRREVGAGDRARAPR